MGHRAPPLPLLVWLPRRSHGASVLSAGKHLNAVASRADGGDRARAAAHVPGVVFPGGAPPRRIRWERAAGLPARHDQPSQPRGIGKDLFVARRYRYRYRAVYVGSRGNRTTEQLTFLAPHLRAQNGDLVRALPPRR